MIPPVLLLVAALGAAAPLCVACGWYLLRDERVAPAEVAPPARPGSRHRRHAAPLTAVAEVAGRRLAPPLLRLAGPGYAARVRRRINAAGRPGGVTTDSYAARKAGFLVIFGSLGIAVTLQASVPAGVVLAVAGWYWVDLSLLVLARQRRHEIEQALPDFLDVLSVTVSAGLSFRQALATVSAGMPGPLAEEFSAALRQMELGTSRREAFEDLRARNRSCEPLAQFVTAVLQAEELGAPLSRALLEISEDMRREAAQSARRRAARTAPRVTLIVTTVMVPGAIILLVGALFIGGEATLPDVFG